MGRDKKAQRTKGNRQPASSSRTASFLDSNTGIIGFGALQDLGYVPAASQGSHADDSAISAEFRVTLRKMMKKDSTTKIKALQEFEVLCQNEEQESVLSALPFWPRLYCKLSIDVERRVREATQVAHGTMCQHVGKHLAPHLRLVMPAWLLGMVDPHTPAASTAVRAFKESFSEEKRSEVMAFTCKEILDHISDNLFTQTPLTLSDPKTTETEDMKNKHIRVQSTSLLALSLLLQTTSANKPKEEKVVEVMAPLLNNPAFWKFAKNKHSLIRHAFFTAVCEVFERYPSLLEGCESELSIAVLPALDDQETTVLPKIWETFLHLSLNFSEFWCEKNSRSSFKRLQSVLREGGRGSATELYPHLLPILSVLPLEAAPPNTHLYVDFLRALSTGLTKPKVLRNSRDVSAIITSLFECLRFVAKKTDDLQLCCTIIQYQMVELVKSSLTDAPQLSTSNLYRELASLLRFFCKGLEAGGMRRDLTKLFWSKLMPECESVVRQGKEEELSRLVVFFLVLKYPKSKMSQRREGIRFADEFDGTHMKQKNLGAGITQGSDSRAEVHISGEVEHMTTTDFRQQSSYTSTHDKDKVEHERAFLDDAGVNLAQLIVLCHDVYLQEKSVLVFNLFSVLLCSFPTPRVYADLVGGIQKLGVVDGKDREKHAEEKVKEGKKIEKEEEESDGNEKRTDEKKEDTVPAKKEKLDAEKTSEKPKRKEEEEKEKESTLKMRSTESGEDYKRSKPWEVLEQVVVPRMEGWDDTKIAQPTVNLFMCLYRSMREEERKSVLTKLKLSIAVVPLHLLMEQMVERKASDLAAAWWLQSAQLGSRLVQLVDCLCNWTKFESRGSQKEQLMALFKYVLSNGGQKEPLIALEYISQILTKLSTSLKSERAQEGQSEEQVVELVTHLALQLFSSYVCWQTKGICEFMKSLFGLLCQSAKSSEHTTTLLQEAFVRGFQGLVTSLMAEDPSKVFQEDGCLVTTMKDIRRIVMEDDCGFYMTCKLAQTTKNLMKLVYHSTPEEDACGGIMLDHSGIQAMLDILIPTEGEWALLEAQLSSEYVAPAIIQGTVSYREFPFPRYTKECPSPDFKHVQLTHFLCSVLNYLCKSREKVRARAKSIVKGKVKNREGSVEEMLKRIEEDVENEQSPAGEIGESKSEDMEVDDLKKEGRATGEETDKQMKKEEGIPEEEPEREKKQSDKGKAKRDKSMQDKEERKPPLENSEEEFEDGEGLEEEISLGQYTHVAVSLLHSACHATATLSLIEAIHYKSMPQETQTLIENFESNMRYLLRRLNQGNKRLIIKQICNRCSDGSVAWCVTLTKVLSGWMSSEDVNASRLLESLDTTTLGYAATKQSLVRYLPVVAQYNILEEEVAIITSLVEDPFSAAPSVSVATAVLAVLRPDQTATHVGLLFSVLAQWRESADNVFMFATDIKGMAWEDISLTCTLVRLLTILVKRHWRHFEPSHWDLLLCSLSSWLQSISDSKETIHKETVACAFTCAVSKCVGCVGEVIEGFTTSTSTSASTTTPTSTSTSTTTPTSTSTSTTTTTSTPVSLPTLPVIPRDTSLPPGLKEDWTEFFSQPIYNTLITLFVDVTNAYTQLPSVILYGVCRCVSCGLWRARASDLSQHSLQTPLPSLTPRKQMDEWASMSLPPNQEALLNHLAPQLQSSHPAIQCATYNLISTSLPDLMQAWESIEVAVNEEEDFPQRPLPSQLFNVIDKCIEEMETSDCFDPETWHHLHLLPSSPVYTPTLGYLLTWRLVLKAVSLASDQHQHQYTAYLRHSQSLPALLDNLFCLMKQRPIVENGERVDGCDQKAALTMFNTKLHITPIATPTSQQVSQLACKVYFECLRCIPAAVRHWFSSLDRQRQLFIDNFTALYVSPLLIAEEMAGINSSTIKFSNMAIRTRTHAREVVASYSIDEGSGDTSKVIELTLRLAPNHPLSMVTVENHRRVGVSLAQWRNWLLGLNMMLQHRNTPLLQSLYPSYSVAPAKRNSTQPVCTSGSTAATTPLVHCAEVFFKGVVPASPPKSPALSEQYVWLAVPTSFCVTKAFYWMVKES
ncbi:hypothetical protein Pcinc_022045 [Petrolisthes cinctipes]|uniref:Uncharacterized protein n=1 Tax=Petrolisthes cinctipes TaxID=88211 RepID=A0AAE1FG69_PETCI|nr:hypothetical protein Pcinc_022045 [Petrolisthes cinctipes]